MFLVMDMYHHAQINVPDLEIGTNINANQDQLSMLEETETE